MNKKQAAYQVGRLLNNCGDAICLPTGGVAGYFSVQGFLYSESAAVGMVNGTILGVVAFNSLTLGLWQGIARILLLTESGEINNEPDRYPLEHANRVTIADAAGLEMLLEKTRATERNEWGTVLKAKYDNGNAIIESIVGIDRCRELGYIKREGKKDRMRIDAYLIDSEGYQGFSHFHPHPKIVPSWTGAAHYSIHMGDRFKPKGWMNLLTFNMPEGPEIVAFNRMYTYIPNDKTKKELVRASSDQIMRYLAS